MVDMTQLTGSYAASWLPWIMIPLIFYILPFPVFALVFLWIEKKVRQMKAQEEKCHELSNQSTPTRRIALANHKDKIS